MTRAQAEQDLKTRVIREYEPAIHALGVDLNQNQFDALCSFVWNLGPGSMSWDVGRYCRARNWGAAANAMLSYDRAGGVVLAGLANRRRAEAALFRTPAKPAPPPDPHHYDWYPTGPFAFKRKDGSTFTLNERGTVLQYDKLYAANRKDKALGGVRAHIQILRDRVWQIAHTSGGPHWTDSRRLGWRFQRLSERLKGPVKV